MFLLVSSRVCARRRAGGPFGAGLPADDLFIRPFSSSFLLPSPSLGLRLYACVCLSVCVFVLCVCVCVCALSCVVVVVVLVHVQIMKTKNISDF